MRVSRIGLLAAIGAALLSTEARAQVEAVSFPADEEVRVWRYSVPRVPLTGRVSTWNLDTLRLVHPPAPPTSIPLSDLARMEISRTKHHAGKGALIGGGIGAALGLITGLAAANDDVLDADGADVIAWTASAAAGGAFWGALIGLLIRSEEWKSVPIPSLGRPVHAE